MMQKQTIQVFLILAAIHSAVFLIYPTTLTEYNDRVNWFAINAIPWWPLYKLGLPVTRHGWLMMPNGIGWAWCALVWSGFYYLVARGITRYRNRSVVPDE